MNDSINEIMNCIHKKVHEHYMHNPNAPKVRVFITNDFRCKLLDETSGPVSTQMEVDFNNDRGGKIAGYPVHVIIDSTVQPYFVFIE